MCGVCQIFLNVNVKCRFDFWPSHHFMLRSSKIIGIWPIMHYFISHVDILKHQQHAWLATGEWHPLVFGTVCKRISQTGRNIFIPVLLNIEDIFLCDLAVASQKACSDLWRLHICPPEVRSSYVNLNIFSAEECLRLLASNLPKSVSYQTSLRLWEALNGYGTVAAPYLQLWRSVSWPTHVIGLIWSFYLAFMRPLCRRSLGDSRVGSANTREADVYLCTVALHKGHNTSRNVWRCKVHYLNDVSGS